MRAYAPPRDLSARLGRRVTQWRVARPADITLARPILSITFDDFPASAARDGANILEAHGVRGSYYASAGLEGQDGPSGRNFTRDDLLRLAASGHEIGCHSYSHEDAATRAVRDTLLNYAKNADAVAAMGHRAPLTTLAYPYGETRFTLKAALPPRFSAARGILPGLNLGRADRAHLRAFPFFGADAFAHVQNALADAARRNAWMIVFTHDVALWPSQWGASHAALTALIRAARTMDFDILPVREAAARAFADERTCAA